MALVAHYDLELHQMNVKMAFLNGDLYEDVYMAQPKGFVVEGQKSLGCHLKKSIYGLKQASSQWYLKFDETIRKFGFKKMKRTIASMQNLRMGDLSSLSSMWMTSCWLAVMLIYYWRQRIFCPRILI